jgi:hypothetical protein
VSARTSFAVADAKGYSGVFDLICFFDCLHDMGDPVGIARHARTSPTTARSCSWRRSRSTSASRT